MPVSMTNTCTGVPSAHGAHVYDESRRGAPTPRSNTSSPQSPDSAIARVQVSPDTFSAGGFGGGGGRGGGEGDTGGGDDRGGGGLRFSSPGCATSIRCSGSMPPNTSLLPFSQARLACARHARQARGGSLEPGDQGVPSAAPHLRGGLRRRRRVGEFEAHHPQRRVRAVGRVRGAGVGALQLLRCDAARQRRADVRRAAAGARHRHETVCDERVQRRIRQRRGQRRVARGAGSERHHKGQKQRSRSPRWPRHLRGSARRAGAFG